MSFAALVDAADDVVQDRLDGELVTYQRAGEPDVTVTGIFDRNFLPIEPGEAFIEQHTPSIWFKLADLPGSPEADDPTVVRGGISYKIRHRETDGVPGQGIRFWLHEVS